MSNSFYLPQFTPGFTPPSAQSCSTSGIMTDIGGESDSMISSMSYQSDPVSKAVVDNILGVLPSTVKIRCDVCDVILSSQIVMDTHVRGNKHLKRVQSAQKMEMLGEPIIQPSSGASLRCEVCNLNVNSTLQMQMHLLGNKHQIKIGKKPSLKRPPAPENQENLKVARTEPGVFEPLATVPLGQMESNDAVVPFQQLPMPSDLVPSDITPETEVIKQGKNKYLCQKCEVELNSEQQVQQHISSRRHLGDGSKGRGKGGFKWGGRGFKGYKGRGKKNDSSDYTQPLSQTFVKGSTPTL